jgi:hypothetical protein
MKNRESTLSRAKFAMKSFRRSLPVEQKDDLNLIEAREVEVEGAAKTSIKRGPRHCF